MFSVQVSDKKIFTTLIALKNTVGNFAYSAKLWR